MFIEDILIKHRFITVHQAINKEIKTIIVVDTHSNTNKPKKKLGTIIGQCEHLEAFLSKSK